MAAIVCMIWSEVYVIAFDSKSKYNQLFILIILTDFWKYFW